MKRGITAAFLGVLLAAPFTTACSDNNTAEYDKEIAVDDTTSTTAEDTNDETVEATTKRSEKKPSKMADISADIGEPEAVNSDNRSQVLFVMDDGSYVYPMFKSGTDAPEKVYVRDDGKGKTEELKLPENSLVYYSDGKKMYYYSPDEGLCEYDGGKSKPLNKETKTDDGYIPEREAFLFTEDEIFFAASDEKGTVIKSMDYSGELSDASYPIDRVNARIIGLAEIDGDMCMLCGYSVGTSETITAVGSNGSMDDISSGNNAYISGDYIYYTRLAELYRKPISGGDEEKVTEEKCADYCFFGDDIIFADATDVYSLDKNGKAKKIFGADKLTKCDYISRVCSVGDKLFVSGGSAAFWSCIAEIDKDGKLVKEYQNGIER